MSTLYSKGREGIADGSIAWMSDIIKVALVDGGTYSADTSIDEFLADVPGVALIDSSPALTTPTVTDGVFLADNPSWAPPPGGNVDYLVLYKDTGSSATSRLIALIDSATGLPGYSPTGVLLTIQWDVGSGLGIFTI